MNACLECIIHQLTGALFTPGELLAGVDPLPGHPRGGAVCDTWREDDRARVMCARAAAARDRVLHVRLVAHA